MLRQPASPEYEIGSPNDVCSKVKRHDAEAVVMITRRAKGKHHEERWGRWRQLPDVSRKFNVGTGLRTRSGASPPEVDRPITFDIRNSPTREVRVPSSLVRSVGKRKGKSVGREETGPQIETRPQIEIRMPGDQRTEIHRGRRVRTMSIVDGQERKVWEIATDGCDVR